MTAAADDVNAAKVAGVTVTLGTDGRLVLKADTQPPDDIVAALRQHKADNLALLSNTPAPGSPSLPVMEGWLLGFGRLDPQRNPGCHRTAFGWATFINDARRFLAGAWAAKAAEAGWTAEHLFGVLPSRPNVVNWWRCLLLLQGGTILDISPTLLKFETRLGIQRSLGRPNHHEGIDIVPVWAAKVASLIWAEIWDLARWYEEEADRRHDGGCLNQSALDDELRRRLAAHGVPPHAMETEFERVMRAVFEAEA
jgi:hypothetical protein